MRLYAIGEGEVVPIEAGCVLDDASLGLDDAGDADGDAFVRGKVSALI